MKSSRSGQSIIEAMVAISILTVGLLGILTLLTKSFQLTRVVDDQTTATYLASEGIEIAKNLIDHDVYLGAASGNNFGGWGTCFPNTGYYQIDYQTVNCPSGPSSLTPDLTPIYLDANPSDPNFGLYSDNSAEGSPTIFSREILVTNNPNEIDVQSTVSWTDDLGALQTITLEDHFYNYVPTN